MVGSAAPKHRRCGGRERQRAGPDLPQPFPGHTAGFARNTVPEDGARPREARRDGVPDAGQDCLQKRPLVIWPAFLNSSLPTGFASWTQILTDWAVSRVWLAADRPRCLADRPELAAPFVAEIGAAIRQRQLHRWGGRLDHAQQQVTEPAFDSAGGPAYQSLRYEMEAAQSDYFSAWCAQRRSGRADEPETVEVLRGKMEQLQAAFKGTRRRSEPLVDKARRAAAKAFWASRDPRVITDTYFADEPMHTVAARMSRIHPPWWGAFHHRLQQVFAHGHPAEGYLLDELPGLRRQATKLTVEATVTGWWQNNRDRWGWYTETEPHYRMLSLRTGKKARKLVCWFNATAPGFLTDQAVRVSLQADLTQRLREADPWSVSAPDSRSMLPWGEHGAN